MQARPEDRFQSRTDQDSTRPRLVHRLTQEESDATEPTRTLPFRLVADFTIQAHAAGAFLAQPDLTPQQRSFFTTVLTNTGAFNRMCRLAIVSELDAHSEEWFKGEFEGPETEDILNCALPYLSADDQEYWNRMRLDCDECLTVCMMEIFLQFTGSLENVAIIDSTTGETIPNRVCTKRCAQA